MTKSRIPKEIFGSNKTNDVNILIGENGSGKSTLLSEIADKFILDRFQVIAIANSIHDKFENSHRIHLLRGRGGRKQIKDIVKKAFRNLKDGDFTRLKNATRAIEYVGYDPLIGFKLNNLNLDKFDELRNSQSLNLSNLERAESLIRKIHIEQSKEEIIWLKMEDLNFQEFEKVTFAQIFKFERQLIDTKIIESIDIFLSKKEHKIPLLSASSGELSLISSIIYLSTTIEEGAIILIDEPENSLHPIWQKHYVKNLMDIFFYYQPKIIIATHSPLIISDSEISVEGTQIFKSKNFEFTLQQTDRINIEEIFFKLFDTVTPQNRYLSNYLIDKLNELAAGEITLERITQILDDIKENSFDEKQEVLSDGVLKLAEQIVTDGRQ
ncbi:AAA family ATPase [Flavobacterium inviolabile]|uniref:AAA family ATPase n=1 Tax=Flavobacterium inviolabile TaxID=2748320 RepID=UPI0015B2ACCE|nr:AAA family ATPase [Flavobacterium inviolabile]